MITKEEIRKLVEDFVDTSPVNRMGEAFGEEKMLNHPLAGFANGADPIFREYKARNGCGFCQTGVPCESRIPEGIDL